MSKKTAITETARQYPHIGRRVNAAPGRTAHTHIHVPHQQPCRRAFTLVEVLVVIVLLGLLAVFVVPQYIQKVGPAKQTVARTQIAVLENHLAMFFADVGRYPTQAEGLDVLVSAPGLAKWKGSYCKASQLIDPWGNPYEYKRPGVHNQDFDIVSLGEDGQPGGDGVNTDIIND